MASRPCITIYDLPAATAQPWAPNIWRIRLILNYKRLPHRTVWVEFPEVERVLRSINAPPTSVGPDGRPVYSLPVIVDHLRSPTHPTVLSNSVTIAEYLDVTYPARPIFPEGSKAVQSLFVYYIQEVFAKPLLPIMGPLSHQRLPDRSQAHFPVGPPPPNPQNDAAWAPVKDQFRFLARLLEKNTPPEGDGVVVQGREVSYADFAICALLIWIERVSPYDGWVRVRSWNGGRWYRIWERCREYMDVY